jgi:hypothetical protein
MVNSRRPQEVLKALHPRSPPQEEIALTLENNKMNLIILAKCQHIPASLRRVVGQFGFHKLQRSFLFEIISDLSS